MRKSLGIVLAVLLVAAMSVPAMGATLSVSGKYVGQVTYDGGVITSVNDGGGSASGVNLATLSTLYLTIDFAEGETMSAHIPLMLYMDRAQRQDVVDGETVTVDVNVLSVDQADTYLVVYKGTPFTLSLTDGTDGDYAFSSFGDPLGLVKYIKTEVDPITPLPTHTLKVTGAPFGIGFTGYAITQDNTDDEDRKDVNPRYAFGRATYELPGGYTVGAIVAGKGSDGVVNEDGTISDGAPAIANVEADVTGPLPVSEGASFTAAVAASLERPYKGEWESAAPALELNLSGITLSRFSLSGNVRAVSPDFIAVAPGPSTDKSDVTRYKGMRQVQGEASTTVDLKGQAIKLTLGDDFRTAYTGDMDDSTYRSFNKVYGSAEISPIEPLTITVGGYYQDYLAKVDSIADDNRKNVYADVEYTPFDYLTVSGGVQWMGANIDNNSGSGFLVEASAEATPIEGVSVTASTSYESGGYDFLDYGTVADNHTRLDYEVYAEAKQTFVPGGVKQVDTTLAGLARGSYVGMDGAGTTYVAYADANIALNDAFSNRLALVTGKTTENAEDSRCGASQHGYTTLVYDKLTWTLSPNSTLSVAYTYDATNSKGSFSGSYKVALGDSTVTLSYGKSGLSWYSCFDDFDDEKPWAWLCNASVNPNPDYFKLSVSIPF